MSRQPSLWNRVNRVRRVTAMIVLLCYALGLGWISVPVAPAKSTTEAYPCQNHACGCSSAAQCWKACCCFTRDQKIAWAEANQVAIPYHLLGEEPPLIAAKKKSGCCSKEVERSCCSHEKPQASCCSQSQPQEGSRCCSHGGCGSKANHKSSRDRRGDDESVPVSITDVLACRGLTMMWVMLPPTLTAAEEEMLYSLSRTFEVLRWSNDVLGSAERMPPIPPPRLG